MPFLIVMLAFGFGASWAQPSFAAPASVLQNAEIKAGSQLHLAQSNQRGRVVRDRRRGGGASGLGIGLGIAVPLILQGLSNSEDSRPNRRVREEEGRPERRRRGRKVAATPSKSGSVKKVRRGRDPVEPLPPSLSAAAPAVAPLVAAQTPRRRDREILVLLSTAAGEDVRIGLMRDYNVLAEPGPVIALLNAQLVRLRLLDDRPLEDLVARLAADPRVLGANLNYVYALMTDKDSAKPKKLPYNLMAINAGEAHRFSQGRDVKVAVIDTCIDASHPELKGAVIAAFDATSDKNADCPANEAHGTGMAGVIAARGLLTGVAPKASIVAVKAFTSKSAGQPAQATTEALLVGIDWAVRQNVRILNLSFAGPRDGFVERIIQATAAKGVLVIAAAGNAGPNAPPMYPAAYEDVVAVTAVGPKNEIFPLANRGAHLGVAAPGVDVIVLKPKAAYGLSSGTSIAAAHVSGIVALMLEQYPNADAAALRHRLISTASDLGGVGPDDQFGAGLADAVKVLDAVPPGETAASLRR
jgi:subtilisin family serine protease